MELEPLSLQDPRRLDALRRVALLDTPAEEAFDRLTRLASMILDVPVALVSLVDADRQFFKSCVGLPEPWASTRETPLSHSFCQHTIATRQPLVIEDARQVPLVRENLAIRDLGVIAYAGIPLVTSDGIALGSFCAIANEPRAWSGRDLTVLTELAGSAMSIIELRATAALVEQTREDRDAIGERLRAIEARERATEQRHLNDMVGMSLRLQRGLLPRRTRPAGLPDVFTFYRPGARTLLIGGDFFDVLDRDGDVHFIVGDVAGHGPEAAALAVALRAAWAALHQHPISPQSSLQHLNRIVAREREDDSMMVTALAGVYSGGSRELVIASGGHPPPLLLTPGATREAPFGHGPALGLFEDSDWPAMTCELAPGAALLAYTDGLIEGRSGTSSRARLGADALADRAAMLTAVDGITESLPRMLYDLATAANGEPLNDDVAVLVLRPD